MHLHPVKAKLLVMVDNLQCALDSELNSVLNAPVVEVWLI